MHFLHHCSDSILFVTGVLNVILGSIHAVVWPRVFGVVSVHLADHCISFVLAVASGGSIVVEVESD